MAERIAIAGFGRAGQQWAMAFSIAGHDVSCHDADARQWRRFQTIRDTLLEQMRNLGIKGAPRPGKISFSTCMATALRDADHVQDCPPGTGPLDTARLRDTEPHLSSHAVIATAAPPALAALMQARCRNPGRVLCARPFTPVHLMSMIEVSGSALTDRQACFRALMLYEDIGRQPLLVRGGRSGHGALQRVAGAWRERIALMDTAQPERRRPAGIHAGCDPRVQPARILTAGNRPTAAGADLPTVGAALERGR